MQENLCCAASDIKRSSAGRLALAPENPVSTYSPAIFQSRREMYSRRSFNCVMPFLSVVDTRQYRAQSILIIVHAFRTLVTGCHRQFQMRSAAAKTRRDAASSPGPAERTE